jgi:hypothetical protein
MRYFYIIVSFVIFLIFNISKAEIKTKVSNLVNPVDYFTGRDEEINILKGYLSEHGKTVAIVGMSGMGKTQLARQYSFNEGKKYNIIWFIDYGVDLNQQFLNLAKEINTHICQNSSQCKIIEDVNHIKDNVISYLNSRKNWLLIFDNITINNSEKINSIIPQTHNGHIIICSQDKNNFDVILPLSTFKQEASERLVSKINSNFSKEQIAELTNMFSGYPILLAKGSIFLLNNKYLTVAEYKNILKFIDTNSEIQKHIKLSIEKLSTEAKDLLLKIALINNRNFSKDFLIKLNGNDSEKLTKNLYALVRFALIEDKGLDTNNTRFEMHDVVKNTILNFNKAETIKGTISKMTRALDFVFPSKEIYQHHILLHRDDTVRSNLEILLQNAENYNSDIYEVLRLRKDLAFIYIDQLDYCKWKEMKKWLDIKESNNEINFHVMTNYQKLIYVSYIIYQGMYELFAVGNVEAANKYLYRALEIAKQIKANELQFTAFMQLAQIAVHSGDVETASINIMNAEQLVHHYGGEFDLWLLCYVKARLLLLEGNYEAALKEVDRSIEYMKHLPQDQFTAPPYLMKTRILLNLNRYEEAYKIANETYDQSKKFFNYDRRLQGRILTLLADAENSLKKSKLALEHIILAKKLFKGGYYKYNDPLTTMVESDIMVANGNYYKAIELYRVVEQVFNERYKGNMKVDVVSILYTKLAKAALKNNDMFLYKQFVYKHEHIFGINHFRTIELYRELINKNKKR